MSYDEKRETPVLFDDIALLFFGRFDSFELLGEVEVSNVSLEGKSNRSSDIDLNLERLQLSYAINDTDKIQIGRFNSDIGVITSYSIHYTKLYDSHVIKIKF